MNRRLLCILFNWMGFSGVFWLAHLLLGDAPAISFPDLAAVEAALLVAALVVEATNRQFQRWSRP